MVATRRHSKPYPPPRHTATSITPATPTPTPKPSSRAPSKPRSRSRSRIRTSTSISTSTSTRASSHPPPSAATQTATPTPSSQPGSWTHRPSPLIMLWLLISIPVVLWDTAYVYLRPYSMPGGFLHFLWRPYGLYGRVDFMYGWPEYRAGNGFVGAQSTLNLVEVVGYVYYLVTVYSCSDVRRRVEEGVKKRAGRKKEDVGEAKRDTCWVFSSKNSLGGREGVIALLVIFACSVMTVSKTVLYGLVEAFSNFRDVGHNSPARLILLWLIPNGLWVVFPSYAAYYFASEILNALQTVTGVPAKEKTRRIKAL